MEVTQEYLKTIFDYHEDGHLIWKVKRNGCKIGNIAGCIVKLRNDMRRVVFLFRKTQMSAKLIYCFHKGIWPETVDHIDRNPLNDKIENLRGATKHENSFNKSKSKSRIYTSKYLGVYKRDNKWRSIIGFNKKKINLGTFETQELAALAYNRAAVKYFGEFANLNIIR